MRRLTKEREREIRNNSLEVHTDNGVYINKPVRDLLAEIDALRAELREKEKKQ